MPEINDDETIEATEEQLTLLREMGVGEAELEDLSFEAADELIAELRATREDAGKLGGA